TEHVEEPPQGNLFQRGRRGGRDRESGVLVPRPRQPVRGQRGGERAPSDEAEIPPASRCHRRRRSDGVKCRKDRLRVIGVLGEGSSEFGKTAYRLGGRHHAAALEPLQVAICPGGRIKQKRTHKHTPSLVPPG